jgi:hypothetical protein
MAGYDAAFEGAGRSDERVGGGAMNSIEPKVVVAVAKVGLRAVAIITKGGGEHFVEVGRRSSSVEVKDYAEACHCVRYAWPGSRLPPARHSLPD